MADVANAAAEIAGAELIARAERVRRARIDLARKGDVPAALELFMTDERPDHPHHGLPIRLAPVHEEWIDLCREHPRLVIWSPPECGKTSVMLVGDIIAFLGANPNRRVAIYSGSAATASKMVMTIKAHIESNAMVRTIWPELKPGAKWSNQELWVRRESGKDPSVVATSYGGTVIGSHFDLIIGDDLLNPENTRTPGERKKMIDWFFGNSVMGRLADGGSVRLFNQAYHPDDLAHHCAKMPGWVARRFPIFDASGEPAFGDLWPLERIEQRRNIDLTPLEFARQMLCRPYDEGTARFKRDWIEVALERGNGRTLIDRLDEPEVGLDPVTGRERNCLVFIGVDLGWIASANSDKTVIFSIMLWPNGDHEVIGIEAGRWAAPEILERVESAWRRYGAHRVIVENVACFPGTAKVLTDHGYVPIADVAVGDHVWTHAGRWRRVTKRFVHEAYSGLAFQVHAAGSVPFVATPNHAVRTRESGRVPGRGGGHHRPKGDPRWVPVGNLRAGATSKARDGVGAHYVEVAIPRWAARPALLAAGNRHRSMAPVPVDRDLAIAIGLYLAEGSCSPSQVRIATHERESHLRAHFANALERLGARGKTIRVGERCMRTYAGSAPVCRDFARMGKGASKALPWEWMGWPLDTRLAIVRGWFMGDGCLRTNNARTKWPVQLLSGVTISRNLALQVRATLLEAGYRATVKQAAERDRMIAGRRVHQSVMYEIDLNAEDTALFLRGASPVEREHWSHWRGPAHRVAAKSCTVMDGVSPWSKLRTLVERRAACTMYSLEVEEDASFVVEDVVVHNGQDLMVQMLRGRSAMPVVPWTTGASKAHPEHGIEGMALAFANGKWIIPNVDGVCHPEVRTWLDELLFYSPLAHTGDRHMASWFACEGIKAHERTGTAVAALEVVGAAPALADQRERRPRRGADDLRPERAANWGRRS